MLAAAAFAAAVPVEQAVVAEAAGVSLGQGMAVYESANLLGMTVGVLGAGLLYGRDGGWELACAAATLLLLAAAVLARPALRGVGATDRPVPPAPPSPAPPAPNRGAAPGDGADPITETHETHETHVTQRTETDDRTAGRTGSLAVTGKDQPESVFPSTPGWVPHAAVYLAAQAILAFAGYCWPVEAVTGGGHDAQWYWNFSGDRLLNADRIWTALFLLDTAWTAGRVARRRRR